MTKSDTLYVVRVPKSFSVQCTDEAKAREALAKYPGATLSARPFPSTVTLPWIGKDYVFTDGVDATGCTYTPLGVTGWGDDRHEAYKSMLRAIRDHLERQTETVLEAGE